MFIAFAWYDCWSYCARAYGQGYLAGAVLALMYTYGYLFTTFFASYTHVSLFFDLSSRGLSNRVLSFDQYFFFTRLNKMYHFLIDKNRKRNFFIIWFWIKTDIRVICLLSDTNCMLLLKPSIKLNFCIKKKKFNTAVNKNWSFNWGIKLDPV